jgi:hypothetical protein
LWLGLRTWITMMVEEWRPIANFSGYEVSNLGCVRSYRRKFGGIRQTPLLLKPQPHGKGGHLAVSLPAANGQRKYFVHRLVLETFVGPCPEGMEGRHVGTNDVTNNCLSNLLWGTSEQNAADKKKHGTHTTGERIGNHKLTKEQVIEIRQRLSRGETGVSLAKKFHVSGGTISFIKHGHTWRGDDSDPTPEGGQAPPSL